MIVKQQKVAISVFILIVILLVFANGCNSVVAEEMPPVTPSPTLTIKPTTLAPTPTPTPTPTATPQPTAANYERLGLNPLYSGNLLALPNGYSQTAKLPPSNEWFLTGKRETVDIDGIMQRLWDGQGGVITEFGDSEATIGYSLYPTVEEGVEAIGHNEYVFITPGTTEISSFSYEWRMSHNAKQQPADMFGSSAPEEEYKALDRAKELVNELLGTDSYTKNLTSTNRFKLTASDGEDILTYSFTWEPDGDYDVISYMDNAPHGFLSATLTGDGIVSMQYAGRIKYAPASEDAEIAAISIEDALYSINYYKSYLADFFGFESLIGFVEAKFGYYLPFGKAQPSPAWLVSLNTSPESDFEGKNVTLAVDIVTGNVLDFGNLSVLPSPFLRQDAQKRAESEARLRGLQEEIELRLPKHSFADMDETLLHSYTFSLGGDFNVAGRISADSELAYIAIEPTEPLPEGWGYEAQEVYYSGVDIPVTEILVNGTEYGKYSVYELHNIHSVIFRNDENNSAVILVNDDDALVNAATPEE